MRYEAATNRMLRVSFNAFMDSLGLVVEVMEKLDEDVLAPPPPGAGGGGDVGGQAPEVS